MVEQGEQRYCEECGRELVVNPQWPHKRYCNAKCQTRAWAKRHPRVTIEEKREKAEREG